MIVAVYGTLKEGFSNHSLIKDFKMIEKDFIKIDALEDCGFPCVKFNKEWEIELEIELYNVDTEQGMDNLDMLEWVPTLYHRLTTETVSGKEVIVYEYTEDIEGIDYNCLEKMKDNKYTWVGKSWKY